MKVNLISEVLCRILFKRLYGVDDAKKTKHEHKLKKMWTDEQIEKHQYSGVHLIASLLSIILWYRNKMAAHAELKPTMDAARICIIALLQSVQELRRLVRRLDVVIHLKAFCGVQPCMQVVDLFAKKNDNSDFLCQFYQ